MNENHSERQQEIAIKVGEIKLVLDADDYKYGLYCYEVIDSSEEGDGNSIIITPTQLEDLYQAIRKMKKSEERLT